jgi:F-type H+-transporting ATPase subunit a
MKKGVLIGAVICVLVGAALTFLFPNAKPEPLTVSLGSPPINIAGLQIPSSVVFTWGILLVLLVAALLVRFWALPRFQDIPKGLQNVLEAAVEYCEDFTQSHVHGVSRALAPYVFTVALYLICSAFSELFGLRPPTTDLTVTFSLSMITFIMINYYGIKENGIGGRLKQFMRPMAFMLPFKLLSDVAIPISLACRLFGNMLGGMIVMNLIYMALGNFAAGVPAVLGLYFNLFHPLIQTFIFLKLSLSFIEEAVD